MKASAGTWRLKIVMAAGAAVLAAAACSGGEEPTSPPSVPSPTAAPETPAPTVEEGAGSTAVPAPTDTPSGPTVTAAPTAASPTEAPSASPVPDASEPTTTPRPTSTPGPTNPPEVQIEIDRNALMWDSLRSNALLQIDAFATMGASGDQSYIPVLLEMFFTPTYFDPNGIETIIEALQSLSGESYTHRQWREWVIWLGSHDEVTPPTEYVEFKQELFARIDPEMAALLGTGEGARIRIEEIAWGGVRKDGIPDLRYPPTISADNADYLSPGDRVFGVSINGEHRAYPLRIVNAHEMVNDTLGGEPFALAY